MAEREPVEGSRFLLRNWRVRSRLVALILVPTMAALLLGGLRVLTSVNTAADYQRVNDLARLVDGLAGLTHELQAERDGAAWNATIGRPQKTTAMVVTEIGSANETAKRVRKLATSLRSEVGGRAGDEIEHIIGKLDGLGPLRDQAVRGNLLPSAVMVQYSLVIDDLLALQDELATGTRDDRLTGMSVALSALAKAKDSVSQQRGLLTTVLPVGRFDQAQLKDFLGALSVEEAELKIFRKNATREERADYDQTVSGTTVDRAEFLRTLVLDRASAGFSLKGLDLTAPDDAGEWFDAMTQPIGRMRTVEAGLTSAIVARSQMLKDDERQRAVFVGAAVAALLIVVLLITTGVAQSLVRPLRRLRDEALEVAGYRLPDTVQRLRESGEIPVLAPIGVVSRDEIGQVARAFDEVHREAVRLAGDEARLRSNVNSMFVNLSRRTQTLVERQLSLIDGLEQGEQDEQRLGNLFRLDHLATRMRRNSENLLVLAGQEPARRWGQPVPIVDVVRAALSEVENYERVIVQVQPGAAVVGQSVNDVVHLVAELVENAISFSSRETKVSVSSSRVEGGGVIISVSDVGIGMTAEELDQANFRLANPPVVDVSVSRRMGLFVVGRLALRHGIRVQLRQQDTGGLTAMVLLPESLLAQPGSAFDGVPGMPQPELTAQAQRLGPAPGVDAPSTITRTPIGLTPIEAMRTPVFGADAPGVGSPPGAAGGGPFERGPFERGPFETFAHENPASRPHENPAARENRAARENPARDADSFTRNPFGSRCQAPIDTPWPGSLPPPGNSAWPGPPQDGGGWPGRPGWGPFDAGMDNAGLLPVVRTSPLEAEEEFLPIFAAVESGWFRRAETPAEEAGSGGKPAVEPTTWSSPADAGWQAAQAVSEPARGGVTASGLPRRIPKANLVPGSASPSAAKHAASPAAGPSLPLSPERVRRRLSGLQRGVRKGRAVAAQAEDGDRQGYAGASKMGEAGARDIEKEDT
ncbi:nitrate- and nitrite sensing domain-containing protein [Planotetraspora sp. A-T 1434]|uniref:sensor histidine kinase n=1 Tax=Planotetraspora sp. A-T 1434 TaxID=2979219 RepID=UPI0021C093BD|nr:nitrate- and nitrite sensing domain-containing protein [Planotetraspora sp. A-T 1434]MCT9929191.1 nitrate- and nitrite sensing domain-containing protein [Planotetraspora sp. A-T 1434]